MKSECCCCSSVVGRHDAAGELSSSSSSRGIRLSHPPALCSPPSAHSYIQRRAREEFHALSLAGREQAAVDAAWSRAASELEVWKRQAVVYGLYGRKVKNVLVRRRRVAMQFDVAIQRTLA